MGRVRVGIPLALVGVLLFGVSRRGRAAFLSELRTGLWLVVHLGLLFAISGTGSFGGAGLLPATWDSLLVAAASLAIYYWGTPAGASYLRREDHSADHGQAVASGKTA